jgi:RNA polymerase sigma-70 factor, ECF subfamily
MTHILDGVQMLIDWSQIVNEHGDAVWRTAYRLLNNEADAWDCYQETFFSVSRTAEANPPQDWNRYLILVATRRALDQLRQRTRSRSRVFSLEAIGEVAGRVASPADGIASRESMEQFRQLLTQLPPNQAAAFWMWGVEELNYEEISQLLQSDVNHVGVLLHRARSRLRQLLAEADANARGSL